MAERALATAFVNIVPGTAALEQYLKTGIVAPAGTGGEAAGKALGSGIVAKAKSFIAPLAGVFAVTAVTGFVRDSIGAASDLNEAGTATTAIFGKAVGKVQQWASGAATALGQSNIQALQAAQTFGIYGQAAGLAADENANFSMKLGGLASDFASFYNASPEEAISAIGAALRGEAEPIRRFGVLLNEATIKNAALKMGLIDSTKEALTPQQKVMAAYQSILDQTGTAQGDFARTSDGLANQQRIAAAQVENLKAKLGGVLLPVMGNLAEVINTTVLPKLTQFIDVVKAGWQWIGENSTWLVPLGIGLSVIAAGFAALNFAADVAAAGGIVKYIASTQLATAVTAAWNAVMAMNPLALLAIAVVAVVAALTYFFTQTQLGQQIWQGFVDALGMAWNWLWTSVLQPVFAAIGAAFQFLWDVIIHPVVSAVLLYIGLWAGVMTLLWEVAVKPALDAIGKAMQWIWGNVIKPVVDWIVAGIKQWGAIFSWLYKNAVQPAIDGIGTAMNWVWRNVIKPVVGWINDAITTVGTTVSDIFGGIADFIGGVFRSIVGVVRGPINSVIDLLNGMIRGLNNIKIDIPDWVPEWGGRTLGFNIPTIPKLAKGGYVDSPTMALIGEAGPEVVTPLKDFERMIGTDGAGNNAKTVNYYAAPNQSLDSEQQLLAALKRAKVVAAW